MPTRPTLLAVFTSLPKTLHDAHGEYRSSIAKQAVLGPVALETRGFVGDQSTQSYHGSPEAAVCFHALAHYEFWNSTYGMALKPGSVGENITLDGADDSTVCVGDVYQAGTARLQISAPRGPCETQARYVGRGDWVKLTLQELRTGFYARVLTPGTLQAGDALILEHRPNRGLSIRELNRCWYHQFDPYLAELYLGAEGLMEWWKQKLRGKLRTWASKRPN
jgi:MOSC domain-containing protein YiiM